MKLIKRIFIFLMMFWSVGFLLMLAVQVFAHGLFDIHFRKVEAGEHIQVEAGDELNVYLVADDKLPDVAALKPEVSIHGSDAEGFATEPFTFRLSRPGEDNEPLYAQGLYAITISQPQTLSLAWANPQPGYFLAVSDSLLRSTIAFFSLIFFSILGAVLLYIAFGNKVLARLSVAQSQATPQPTQD